MVLTFYVFRMALTFKTLITQPVHKLEASTVLTHSNPAQVSETFVTDNMNILVKT